MWWLLGIGLVLTSLILLFVLYPKQEENDEDQTCTDMPCGVTCHSPSYCRRMGDFFDNGTHCGSVCTHCGEGADYGVPHPALPSNSPKVQSSMLPYSHPLGSGLPQHVYYA